MLPMGRSDCNKNSHISVEPKRPVVFLDRDGTLNIEAGYIREVENLNLIDGAGVALKKLNDAGVAAILVTNQTGAARGYYDESHIHALHERLTKLLAEHGAHLDDIYYCPHLAEGTVAPYAIECDCRKPEVGMVEKAFSDHSDLDRARSFVVGDKASDIDLARNCKSTGVLVKTGYGEAVLKGEYQWVVQADYEASSIVDGIDWILRRLRDNEKQS
jgi:D-glycero-D-manno-heptose 1,7-bisphosphate phosphatase